MDGIGSKFKGEGLLMIFSKTRSYLCVIVELRMATFQPLQPLQVKLQMLYVTSACSRYNRVRRKLKVCKLWAVSGLGHFQVLGSLGPPQHYSVMSYIVQ